MAFPTSPTNGQLATVNNIIYSWNSAKNAWVRATTNFVNQPGNVTVYGNLIPSSNVAYDLGTTTSRFRSLYLSGNTIDLSGATIKTDAATGAVALIAQPTTANPNPTGIVISPSGAITTVATTGGVVAANAVAIASNAAVASTATPLIANVVVTNSSYNPLDDSAVSLTGGYLRLTGSGFDATSTVLINNTPATSTTYGNSTTLYVQTPVLTTGTYNLYVVNSSGATGIRINGLTASQFTAWTTATTLANVQSAQSFGVNLSATSDSTITYANTTALPPGTTLASNGYFSGTITVGSITTYSFTVDATDLEKQDAVRTFSLTVTLVPPTKLWSWGQDGYGQLAQNTVSVSRSSPTQVGAGTNWLQASSNYNNLAVKTDGTLWFWGQNGFGQSGTNDVVNRSSPTQVGALTNWLKVLATYNTSFAVKTDGTLWSWGRNHVGQLGQNDQVYRSSPVQVGAGTTWSRGFGGYSSIFFLKTDGTLWGWGMNSGGPLATGDVNLKSSPIQIGSGNTWLAGSSGYQSLLAVRSDGTLWAAGKNDYGTLGLNNSTQKLTLTQVGSGTTWLAVAGVYQTIALKTDGTLWSWGYNVPGLLGQNTGTGNTSSPVQVGAGTTWSQVSAGYDMSAAIKTDGTLWTWGADTYGQLGQNDVAARSIPTQVGTNTNWTQVSASFWYGVRAITTN